jgi:choline-sulfatase
MTRTRIALTVAVVALGAGSAFWALKRPRAAAPIDGPIVLISIDTLRADRLPAYGYTKTRTPNIDRFIADAVLFEQAYSHSPQTLPAHTSILSGELPFEHGVRDNIGFSVTADQRFLQHNLKDAGFATGGFVSAYVLRHQTGINSGFEVYDDALPASTPDRPLGQVQRAGAETVAAARAWIDRQPSAKFFAFVHIYEPHKPYTPPQRFAAADPYDGEVEHADEIVGQLLDHLRAKGLYDRATILLLSDHGEGLGDHGEDEHGIFLYRETIRVPFMVKLPGVRGSGRRVAAPVQHVDVMPTILELAGISGIVGVKADATRSGGATRSGAGRSLVPVLRGSGNLEPASIYSESLSPRYHFGWSELYALTDDRYRLIRAPRDELYDIQRDAGERTSIAAERPQVRMAMRRALDEILGEVPVNAPSSVSDEDRRKLAALGYVGTQSGASLSDSGDRLPDPKDKIGVLQKYKRATNLARDRKFADAIALYRELLEEEPDMTDVWLQLAEIYGRRGMTQDMVAAYKEAIERNPKDPAALTGAATGLLRLGRLDEARAHSELAIDVARPAAHELLARIALERGDAAAARREAQLAHEADRTLPLPAVIEGRLLHKAGQFEAAIQHFLEAKRALASRTLQMPDVNYYLGDCLARLERYAEAEPHFLEELAIFPTNARARAGLAMLYRAMARDKESEQAIADLIRHSPTREGYDLAAQLWTMFGEPRRAAEARAAAGRLPQ